MNFILIFFDNSYRIATLNGLLYQPGDVANTRDPDCPFCFVESAHGLGEWRS
ncbi:MAG: type I-F CRISPR-associated protein Csy2, partial [Candidatus Altiarchaeota archaeon]|nr:type I-F CRISPR-associated protein Csy2 [Candidatus Altiarchaeota archaeon]